MSFTGFVARMKDGKCFSFGTRYLFEFFHMPDGYSVDEIEEIINHSYVSETGEIKSYRRPDGYPDENITIYRERPYFVCYVDEL